MAIVLNKPLVEVFTLQYKYIDPSNKDYLVYKVSDSFDLHTIKCLYTRVDNTMYIIPKSSIVELLNNRIKFKQLSYSMRTDLIVLVDRHMNSGIDYIDRYHASNYITLNSVITITNDSFEAVAHNVTVLSEDTNSRFSNSYPFRYKHKTYSNGVISESVSYDTQLIPSYNSNNLIGLFNSLYIGNVTPYGNFISAFSSSKAGTLEIIYLGQLEFSVNSNGPWSRAINAFSLQPLETREVYVRCSMRTNQPAKYLNSIRVFATEEL